MKIVRLAILLIILFIPLTVWADTAPVYVLSIKDQIDPATADYLIERINDAEDSGVQAVLITIDTPGGLMTSMEKIVGKFLASRVPVIVFVYPDGASATSAGTFITLAANIAAMAPTTTIGAASPVIIGPSGESEKIEPTMRRKMNNSAAAYARSIAERRGRNADWAEEAVRGAVKIDAEKALKINVINYIARNPVDLLKKIDGDKVKLASGNTVVLHTADAPLKEMPMGLWETFFHYLSNPLIVLILMMMAMYGIFFELAHPGAVLPGVVGAISVILLLYSYSVVPISVAGIAFIILAIALFIAELFVPGVGVLAGGGIISMFLGLMMIFRSAEGFTVSIWILGAVTLLTAAFFMFIVRIGLRALRRPYVAGEEGLIGQIGEARTELNPTGKVFVAGTWWTATSEEGTINKGEKVEIIAMSGLKLTVRRPEPF